MQAAMPVRDELLAAPYGVGFVPGDTGLLTLKTR